MSSSMENTLAVGFFSLNCLTCWVSIFINNIKIFFHGHPPCIHVHYYSLCAARLRFASSLAPCRSIPLCSISLNGLAPYHVQYSLTHACQHASSFYIEHGTACSLRNFSSRRHWLFRCEKCEISLCILCT